MRPALLSLVAMGVLAVGAVSLGAEEKIEASPYYPLKVGTKWQYRLGEEKVHIRVARHEKVGNEGCAVLESVQDGKVIETETIAVRKDGLYRIATDDGPLNPPMCFLKLPPRRGASWDVNFQIGDAKVSGTLLLDTEEVQVPAGKFSAVVTRDRDFQINGTKLDSAVWFVSGIGPVKKWVKVGKLEMVLALEKFEPAP
jgi:hypothetical protein